MLFLLAILPSHAQANALDTFKGLSGRIDVAGGTAHLPFLREAAKRIHKEHPSICLRVTGGGSGFGIAQLIKGNIEVASTGRPLTNEEASAQKLITMELAVDGIAVIVHPANPLHTVDKTELRKIFTGEVTGYNVFAREHGSGTGHTFNEFLGIKSVGKAHVLTSNAAMHVAVENDKKAVGILSVGFVDHKVKALSIDGVSATRENVLNESYPLARKLYLHIRAARGQEKLLNTLCRYLFSPSMQTVKSDLGLIPLPLPEDFPSITSEESNVKPS